VIKVTHDHYRSAPQADRWARPPCPHTETTGPVVARHLARSDGRPAALL